MTACLQLANVGYFKTDYADISGGQTGEWALVQEEQMCPLLTPGKISLNR